MSFEHWRGSGGLETILSYGLDAHVALEGDSLRPQDLSKKLPETHLRFFSALEDVCSTGRYCFVHAGLRPVSRSSGSALRTWPGFGGFLEFCR